MLPLLNTLRRRTGLPHKILLDEAHYYIGGRDGGRLIDAELAGYILVSYRISGLPTSIRGTSDAVVLVTRETDPREAETLLRMCRPQPEAHVDTTTFQDLAVTEAALLPGPEESHGQVLRFQFAPRVTVHVRHRSKYLEMPAPRDKAFVFTEQSRPGPRARTLKELMGLLTVLPADQIQGHLERQDFSRWLADVFRDMPLASHVKRLEERSGVDDTKEIAEQIVQSIRARYEPAPDAVPARSSESRADGRHRTRRAASKHTQVRAHPDGWKP